MTAPFETTRDKPVWRVCYDAVAETEVGNVVTYGQIEHDARCTRSVAQQGMIKANIELGRAGVNQVRTLPNVGWVVIAPADAIPLAAKQRSKAGRADDRHAGRINAIQRRRGELTGEQQALVDHEQRVALRKAEINGRRMRETRSLADRLRELEA